jgi:hypothetical protein
VPSSDQVDCSLRVQRWGRWRVWAIVALLSLMALVCVGISWVAGTGVWGEWRLTRISGLGGETKSIEYYPRGETMSQKLRLILRGQQDDDNGRRLIVRESGTTSVRSEWARTGRVFYGLDGVRYEELVRTSVNK